MRVERLGGFCPGHEHASRALNWYMNCSSLGILPSATTNMSCGSPFLGSAAASKGQDGHLDLAALPRLAGGGDVSGTRGHPPSEMVQRSEAQEAGFRRGQRLRVSWFE